MGYEQQCPVGLPEFILKNQEHALLGPFLCLAVWNMGVMAGVLAAILDHKGHVLVVVEQRAREN